MFLHFTALFAIQEWHAGVATVLAGAAGYLIAELRKALVDRNAAKIAERNQQAQQDAASRKTALEEWKEVVNRQNQTITKLEQTEENCRRREMRLQRAIVYLHGVVSRQVSEMRANGMQVEEIRPLSDFIQDEIEFAEIEEKRRGVAQATVLVKAEAEKITKDGGPPTTPPMP